MIQNTKATLPKQLCSLILKTIAHDSVAVKYFRNPMTINDFGWHVYDTQKPQNTIIKIEYKHTNPENMTTVVDITIRDKTVMSVYSGHPFIQKLAGELDAKSIKLSCIGDTELSPAQMAAVEYLQSINSR